MTDSRSTLDDEVDDEPPADSRETCFFWDARAGWCHFEALIPDSEPCADCPNGMEDFAAYLVNDMGYSRNPCPDGCPYEPGGHVHLHSPGNPASKGTPDCDFILWADGSSSRSDPTRQDGAAERERIRSAGAVSACCGASYIRPPGAYSRWVCGECGQECDLIGVIA